MKKILLFLLFFIYVTSYSNDGIVSDIKIYDISSLIYVSNNTEVKEDVSIKAKILITGTDTLTFFNGDTSTDYIILFSESLDGFDGDYTKYDCVIEHSFLYFFKRKENIVFKIMDDNSVYYYSKHKIEKAH